MADTLQTSVVDQKLIRERLATWDAKVDPKAPLTDKQKDVLMELTTLSRNRPIPSELPLDDIPMITARLSTKIDETESTTKLLEQLGLGKEKVENSQQFFSWFAGIEEKIEQEEEQAYRLYIDELKGYREQCSQVMSEVSSSLLYLYDLQKQYIHVSTKTNALHEACEHLLDDQTRLMNTAESISNKLSYFNELDRISSLVTVPGNPNAQRYVNPILQPIMKLGSPALTVTNESFVPMLSRLDECILYLTSNPRYKESDVYLARFKQSLSRALNLIKTHVFTILKNSTQQVTPQKDATAATDNAFTLFYGKFRTNAPRVKSLMEQVEQRIDKSPAYQQILTDCHQCYFSQRESLLGPSVASSVSELNTTHARDHCALMRSGCAFMVHVCEDEYQLYFHFFSSPSPLLDAMLEKLCNHLYDMFRPFIIHILHLETLAELCSILKMEMIEDHVQNNPQELRAFENICKQMLMDVQERLVYRTYIYIKSDVLNYAAADGDLAYPEKLEMMESIAESLKKTHSRTPSNASSTSMEVAQLTEQNGDEDKKSLENGTVPSGTMQDVPLSSSMPMSPADLHGMWYPTVRRTLVTLSKLYRCIDKTTFQGLSQETLSSCIESLNTAKKGITKRGSVLDGQLFLIKHLLILREQIVPFQADMSIRETSLDFTKIRELTNTSTAFGTIMDAAYGLFQKKSHWLSLNRSNALLQFVLEGTPQVTEYYVDSKREVDSNLKKTCEAFIHHVTDLFSEPLKTFLSKAAIIINMADTDGSPKVSLRQQPFARAEKVQDIVAETYKNLKTNLPKIQRSMSLYMANRDTEGILFKPVKVFASKLIEINRICALQRTSTNKRFSLENTKLTSAYEPKITLEVNVQQAFQQLNKILLDSYSEEDIQIVACPSSEQINLLLSTSAKK